MTKKETKPKALEFFDTTPVELDPIPEDPSDAILRRIAEFEDTLPDLVHDWNKGDPAPEWMGPRPVWAEDYYDRGDSFVPNQCFWQGDEIRMPVVGLHGSKSDDKSRRIMGSYQVFLRQHPYQEPMVIIRVGPKSSEYHLPLSLREVDDLVAALEMLADIAKTSVAADPAGGGSD